MDQTLNILIIDDEELVCRSLERVLSKEGHSVFSVPSGEKGLKLLETKKFDLILLDFFMPGMNGRDVLKKIQFDYSDIKVIAMSGQGSLRVAMEMLQLNALDFLVKPVNLNFLLDLIKDIQTKKGPVSIELSSSLKSVTQPTQEFIGSSQPVRKIRQTIGKIAPKRSNVLIQGETGSGKDVIAHELHRQSPRQNGPFVAVNCHAMPEHLLESELFGFEKGAFTGAGSLKQGLLETAHFGTLFLDEIGEISPALQAKLLRVVETKRFRRLGSTRECEFDARIISATNKELAKAVKTGDFRSDLYYRLSVITLNIPPLRDRKEDIPLLIHHFLKKLSPQKVQTISDEAMTLLVNYSWPGNIRELRNLVEHLVIFSENGIISSDLLPIHFKREGIIQAKEAKRFDESPELMNTSENEDIYRRSIALMEKEHIMSVLKDCRGHRSLAAQALGISDRTLYYKLKKYKINN